MTSVSASHAADPDFRAVVRRLGQLSSCAAQANRRALSSSRKKKLEVIDGNARFIDPTMRRTWRKQEGHSAARVSQRVAAHKQHRVNT